MKEWEYLYERSIGCVGVLKDWLVRALTGAFRRKATVLTPRDLQTHALSVPQCDKMLSEAWRERGDCRRARRSAIACEHDSAWVHKKTIVESRQTTRKPKLLSRLRRRGSEVGNPGSDIPRRDPIGLPTTSYATAINALTLGIARHRPCRLEAGCMRWSPSGLALHSWRVFLATWPGSLMLMRSQWATLRAGNFRPSHRNHCSPSGRS